MLGGGVDAATLVAALGAGPPPPECRWGRRPRSLCQLFSKRFEDNWHSDVVASQEGVFPTTKQWLESHGGRKPGASRSRRAVWVIAPSSLSGEDSCFVVSQVGVFLTGPPSALMVVQLGKRPLSSQQTFCYSAASERAPSKGIAVIQRTTGIVPFCPIELCPCGCVYVDIRRRSGSPLKS